MSCNTYRGCGGGAVKQYAVYGWGMGRRHGMQNQLAASICLLFNGIAKAIFGSNLRGVKDLKGVAVPHHLLDTQRDAVIQLETWAVEEKAPVAGCVKPGG
jgi:hypothetical protein